MKKIYINTKFNDPAVMIRYPLTIRYGELKTDSPLLIEDHPIIENNSVYMIERFCLNYLSQYITDNQLNQFANLSDGHLLFIEDFTLPIEETANHIIDLVKIYKFSPNKLWFRIAWNHEKNELEKILHANGIHGVNIRIHNCYLEQIYAQYIQHKSLIDSMSTSIVQHRFSIFTRRYHPDRLSFFLKLIDSDLLQQCDYTFTNFSPEIRAYPDPWITKEELKNDSFVKLYPSKKFTINNWIDGLPYCLDTNDLRQSFPLEIYKRYATSGLNIAHETTVGHYNDPERQDIMITEKTFKAILSKKPFMMLAPSGSLALLKKEGFKTFDSLIDESYDTTDDLDEKQNLVIGQMKKLSTLTDAEYFREIENLDKITKYNFRRFLHLGMQSSDYSIFYDLDLIKSSSVPKIQ
jgi:hypothetical protein